MINMCRLSTSCVHDARRPGPRWSILTRLSIMVTLLTVTSIATVMATTLRNANPNRDFAVVEVPVLFMNITSPGWTGPTSIPFHPSFGGGPLPLSTNSDFSLDVPIMLPNSADDIDGCLGPWNTTNEFGQAYATAGAFVLIRQSSCTYYTYLMAAYSGAAGIIIYGCPGEKPYNCETKLHEILVYTPIPIPVISISTADGEALVAYLSAAKSGGVIPPVTTLMGRFISTGTIVPAERVAIEMIMAQSVMGPFAGGSVPDVLPLWNYTQLVTDSTFDPCRARLKGLWCEGGHVVLISVFYQEWYNFDVDSSGNPLPSTPSFLPTQFGAFTKLRYLNIQANAFAGAIPPEWCAMTDLRSMWLDSQYRTWPAISSLPNCIGNLTKLEELRLLFLGLQTLPPSVSTLTNLRKFVIGINSLVTVPDISGLVNLEEFDASQNSLTILPTPNSSALLIYSVPNNQFNGTFPVTFFDNLVNLQIVDVNSNHFSGPLPNLVGCTNLLIADFGSQRDITIDVNGTGPYGFTGGMPASWSALDKLTQIYLQENLLTGPMIVASMQSLEYVDVSYNLLASSTDPADADNAAGILLNSLTSPSQISIRASGNINFSGVLASSNFILLKTIRELYLSHCGITGLTKELLVSPLTTIDFSYNNISRDVISAFPIGNPPSTALLIDLRGNPYYSFDSLPPFIYAESSRVQASGSNYACAPLKSNVAPLLSFLVDSTFYNYQYCECASGYFGKPPLCSHIPSSASLNPLEIITSTEIGAEFPDLISRTNGVGSDLYALNPDGTPVSKNNTVDVYAQSFSDSMYGENRLTLGMATSWVIDLSNLFSDDIDAYVAGGLTPPSTTQQYHQDPTLAIPNLWTPVRMITVRLHISATEFTDFEDLFSVFEGGSDLKGNRVLTIRGTDTKPTARSSAYTRTSDYLLQNNASLSQIQDPRLIEVQVFSRMATVQFTSRDSSGLHFYATYSYDFECPSGYFYNTAVTPAQCHINLEQFTVGMEIRDAVFAVSALSLAWVLFNIIILLIKWESPVYKAASRVFMLLILVLLLTMPLGSLLYATIPEVGTSLGSAVCIGRAWLTCLPLAGVLGVLLAKTNRLDSIFGATKLQVRKHTDLDILKVVLVVCCLQILLLAIFSGLPLSRAVLQIGKGSLSDELVTSCSQESGFMSWFGAEVAFMAALMLPAAYLGFKTRDLPSQFNESAHIQNALLLLMFFGCIIIPLDIFIQDNPEAAVLIQGLGQAFLCFTLTGIIFGPKLYYLTTIPQTGQTATYVDNRNSAISVVGGAVDTPATPGGPPTKYPIMPYASKVSGEGTPKNSQNHPQSSSPTPATAAVAKRLHMSINKPPPYVATPSNGHPSRAHNGGSGGGVQPIVAPSPGAKAVNTFNYSQNSSNISYPAHSLSSLPTQVTTPAIGTVSSTYNEPPISPRSIVLQSSAPPAYISTNTTPNNSISGASQPRRVIKFHTSGGSSVELIEAATRPSPLQVSTPSSSREAAATIPPPSAAASPTARLETIPASPQPPPEEPGSTTEA